MRGEWERGGNFFSLWVARVSEYLNNSSELRLFNNVFFFNVVFSLNTVSCLAQPANNDFQIGDVVFRVPQQMNVTTEPSITKSQKTFSTLIKINRLDLPFERYAADNSSMRSGRVFVFGSPYDVLKDKFCQNKMYVESVLPSIKDEQSDPILIKETNAYNVYTSKYDTFFNTNLIAQVRKTNLSSSENFGEKFYNISYSIALSSQLYLDVSYYSINFDFNTAKLMLKKIEQDLRNWLIRPESFSWYHSAQIRCNRP